MEKQEETVTLEQTPKEEEQKNEAAETTTEAVDQETAEEVSEESELSKYKKLAEEQTKLAEENRDRLLRTQADFENYKKRTAKEREDIYTMSLEKMMKDILPIIDNLERAIASLKKDEMTAKYVEGVEMIHTQLITTLEKHQLKEIEAQDQEFDPNFHHAVMQCEAQEEDENKVKMVLQKGYLLGDRVIRPAMVQVAVKQ